MEDEFGDFEFWQLFFQQGQEVAGLLVRSASVQLDEGYGPLTELLIGDTHHKCIQDTGQLSQRGLDFFSLDVLTT